MPVVWSSPAVNPMTPNSTNLITCTPAPALQEPITDANIVRLSNDELGTYIQNSTLGILRRLDDLRPYYVELWKRFDELKDGETICGCTTRKQYCDDILKRSIRSVQYAINGRPESPKPVLPAPSHNELTCPVCSDVLPSRNKLGTHIRETHPDRADEILGKQTQPSSASQSDTPQDSEPQSCGTPVEDSQVPPENGGATPTVPLQPSDEPEEPRRTPSDNAPSDPASETLTESFYVIRRKSDGAFLSRFHGNESFSPVDSILEAERFFDIEDADLLEVYIKNLGERSRTLLTRSEWEWVRVDAKYSLTVETGKQNPEPTPTQIKKIIEAIRDAKAKSPAPIQGPEPAPPQPTEICPACYTNPNGRIVTHIPLSEWEKHQQQYHSETTVPQVETESKPVGGPESKTMVRKQAKPWIDYDSAFLTDTTKLSDWLQTLPYKPETGACDRAPTHDTIQFGPRQAYVSCVPKEFRVTSSGPIPEELKELHERVERRYQAAFNTIQINRHWNENSFVSAHSDNMHGHIVMLSLGAPRRFILRYKHDDKAKAARWKAGDIYLDRVLDSGSLLTIYLQHQFDLTHEMPISLEPCGPRISLIWRYLTQSVVDGPLGRRSLADGSAEFKTAQEAWKAAQRDREMLERAVAGSAA